jgi:hypothetical protein
MVSLAEFALGLFAERVGAELGRARVGGREVALAVDPRSPLAWMNGASFQPLVTLRVDGRVVSEQEVALEGLDATWFERPAPDARWLGEAGAQIAAWRERVGVRLAQIPEGKLEETLPFDVSFAPAPLSLAVFTLDHGPPPPRPTAGRLGAHGARTAAALRALPHGGRALSLDDDERCAFAIGDFVIRIRHTPDDADEPAGFIHLEHGAERALVVYSNGCERGDAFSVDGNEPLYRLASSWLVAALTATGLEQPGFPDPRLDYPPIPLASWLLFGDHDGPPLDHRIEPGAIRDSSYADIYAPLPAGTIEAMPRARALYHRFVREVVDPDVRTAP